MTELSLSVQYATDAPELPRWRLRGWVKRALKAANGHTVNPLREAVLTIRIVDPEEMQVLNRTYRGRDYPTNVLTFTYDPASVSAEVCQADLVICHAVLRKEALEQNKPILDHAAHLCIHATLHALGFDHESEEQARLMESLETEILASMGIADPYLVQQ